MYTCGMYNFAGQWAYKVGLPAKSGVSGGIIVVVPQKMGIAVFSPPLDSHGSSVRGMKVCEDLSERFGLHLFDLQMDSNQLIDRFSHQELVDSDSRSEPKNAAPDADLSSEV